MLQLRFPLYTRTYPEEAYMQPRTTSILISSTSNSSIAMATLIRELFFSPQINALWLLILLFCAYQSSAAPSDVCKFTPDPAYCKSVLPNNNPSASVYDYGRFSLQKSYNAARNFYNLVQNYLQKTEQLSAGAVRALEDCLYLAGLNIDYLSRCSVTVNGRNSVLSTEDAEYTQTVLSAILTNTYTCNDGIQEVASTWSVKDNITSPLADNSKLFSVSLGLFNQGWVPVKKNRPRRPLNRQLGFANGRVTMKMSSRVQAIYDSFRNRHGHKNRRLLQSGNEVVSINNIVVVSQDGSGNYTTINGALAAAPVKSTNASGYYLIYVTAGIYKEYVAINSSQTYLLMVGDGINQTIITGNHSVDDGWTTFTSGTFSVVGQGFLGAFFTVRNTAGPGKHQAVAVRNGADLSTFYNCSFEGYQDTLYPHSLRQFYKGCDIYGTVDFIFGNAAVVFQDCNIYARLPIKGQFNTLTAQGKTDPNQNTGTSFQNCRVAATPELVASNFTVKSYLGRPWKQYSTTVFMQSYLGSLIDPAGWSVWSGDFALNTSFYAEFNNTGPGSNTSQRVSWSYVIDANNASSYTVANFLLGDAWIPQTGIAYTSGLYA